MSIISVCKHASNFKGVKRLTNLQGVIFADCGRDVHFADLRKIGTTTPFPSEHFSVDINERARQLPINCSAWYMDGRWHLDSVDDIYAPVKNDIVCLTEDQFSMNFENIMKQGHVYLKTNDVGGLTILRHVSNMRFLPIWFDEASCKANLGNTDLSSDTTRKISIHDFQTELEHIMDQGIEFCNVMYGASEYQRLVLIWELLNWFEKQKDFE